AKAEMRPKLVLFGDSITEESFGDGGWAAALAHHFSRSVSLLFSPPRSILFSISPSTDLGWGFLSVVWFDLFDSLNHLSGGHRAAGVQRVQHPVGAEGVGSGNGRCFFRRAAGGRCSDLLLKISVKEKWDSTIMILITPPPIDEHGRIQNPYGDNSSGLPERTNEVAGAYAKACVAVAEESGLPVIDIWTRMHKFPGWEKLFLRTSPREGRKIEAA
ncbi:hypothetical protein GW17_00059197, partial [Ensete ventricosum]